MSKFSYFTPKTIKEALSKYNEESKQKSIYMAGGTDVLLKIKKGEISPTRLISLNYIDSNNEIQMDSNTGELTIGGFVTHRTLETSNLISRKYKIIHDAVSHVGSVQIRNVGTIGGNLVNAAPSADTAIPLIALDSRVRLCSENGYRIVNLIDFFVSPGKTILEPGEILTDIIVPKQDKFTSGGYKKFTRRAAMELPIVGVAVLISLEKNTNICKKARICLGVAAPTPIRAFNAEKFLEGNIITEELLSEAGKLAVLESKTRDSIRSKAWFRKELISVFVKRMGMLAIKRIESCNTL